MLRTNNYNRHFKFKIYLLFEIINLFYLAKKFFLLTNDEIHEYIFAEDLF